MCSWSLVHAVLLDAIARDRLGDPYSAASDIERALDLAEPDGIVLPFALTGTRDLLERHRRHRTAHAALLVEILDMLSGSSPPRRHGEPAQALDPLSDGELRVLRYLPSNLSAPEIGAELYVSINTIRTHSATSTRSSASTDAPRRSSERASSDCSRRTRGPPRHRPAGSHRGAR